MTAVNDRVRIVADDRENAGGVIGALQRHEDVALTVRRLRVGDFLVGECCIVERKTLGDFARSVSTHGCSGKLRPWSAKGAGQC